MHQKNYNYGNLFKKHLEWLSEKHNQAANEIIYTFKHNTLLNTSILKKNPKTETSKDI